MHSCLIFLMCRTESYLYLYLKKWNSGVSLSLNYRVCCEGESQLLSHLARVHHASTVKASFQSSSKIHPLPCACVATCFIGEFTTIQKPNKTTNLVLCSSLVHSLWRLPLMGDRNIYFFFSSWKNKYSSSQKLMTHLWAHSCWDLNTKHFMHPCI